MRISDWSSDVCSSDLLRNTGKGWVTAEYGMLPRATHTRGAREAARGSQSGRPQEIQRLIGRSLRAVTNMETLGEIHVRTDCDVLQAVCGERTPALTGTYVELHLAFPPPLTNAHVTESTQPQAVAALSHHPLILPPGRTLPPHH